MAYAEPNAALETLVIINGNFLIIYNLILIMEKLALLARVEAKPGKEAEVLAFLKRALPLEEAEPGARYVDTPWN